MTTSKHQKILVENGFVTMPSEGSKPLDRQKLITLLGNISYYGFALSQTAYDLLHRADESEVVDWWVTLEKTLKSITGDDKNMGDFVVYKNFPQEVLEMSQVDYWSRQILMYWGFPNEYFTKEEVEREVEKEKLPVKVLQPATSKSLGNIFNSLLRSQVRWTKRQWETVRELLSSAEGSVDISAISFKENMVRLAALLIKEGREVSVRSATDVLRLAVGLSDGDVSMRTNSKLRRFKRPERKFLLSLLEDCKNVSEDVARRKGQFKRLFFELRPGDYKSRYPNVVSVYDKLYRGAKFQTFNSEVERLLSQRDPAALNLLKARAGEFVRRLRVATNLYGEAAIEAFRAAMPRLSVHQLLKIERQLITANDRTYRAFPPRGNWTKLQVSEALPSHRWNEEVAIQLSEMISSEVRDRVSSVLPAVRLSKDVEKVKLQGNDSDLSPYGRGTVFDIPENITFLRSASYWKTGGGHAYNIWFDNGWNFFDEKWKSAGVCCWNANRCGDAAIFSGDPTNSKELEGRACQMIDLYLDKMMQRGVRYAVWNILCYSHKSFDQAEEVHAALQWGEKPQKNNLFEPSRCVFSFPVKGANMTKYIAYVDVWERKLVYMDANLYGRVSSAASNTKILEKTMPAYVEYLNSLPSVFDLFKGVPAADDAPPVLYDDSEERIEEGQAYVFLPRSKHNKFDQLDLNSLLEK